MTLKHVKENPFKANLTNSRRVVTLQKVSMAGRLVSCSWIIIFMNSWLWKADFLFKTRLSLTEVNYNQQMMIDKFRTLTFPSNQTKKALLYQRQTKPLDHTDCIFEATSLPNWHVFPQTRVKTQDVKDDFRPKSSRNHFWTINPLHIDISMLILHTVLHTFLKVLTRRIYITIKGFFSWRSFPLFSLPYVWFRGYIVRRN